MPRLKLKKEINLFTLVIYGVGVIVGAGIYVLIGKAAGIAGNSIWMAFFLSSIIAVFTSVSYAELSSVFAKTASEYHYIKNVFGKNWLSLVVMVSGIAGNLIGAAAVSLGFAGYFTSIFGTPFILNALGVVIILSLVNFWGIGKSTKITILMTLVTILGLILIIIFGLPHWGSVDYFEMPNGIAGVISATALIFFAYIGFEDLVNVSEEVKIAKKNVPKALIFSLIISSIFYVLVSVSVVSVVDWKILGTTNAPLELVADAILGDYHPIMSFIILFATGGTILILLIAASRMIYGLSNVGEFPKFLSKVHKKTKTPYYAVFISMIITLGFVLIREVDFVAKITDFTAFLTFGIINLANIGLRYRKPYLKREFKAPLNIGKFPVLSLLGVLTCVFMVFFLDRSTVIIGFLVVLIGSLLLIFWQKIKKNKSYGL